MLSYEHDWVKATLVPAGAVKDSDVTNLTYHFQGRSLSFGEGTTPENNFYMNWQSVC